MKFKLHRVAPNSEGWRRPSPGRLGKTVAGSYVAQHGFGHEDWNFNFDFAIDGLMPGYTVAQPANGDYGKEFGLVLATYDAGRWYAVGYYEGAVFSNISHSLAPSTIDQMAIDVFELAEEDQVASDYRSQTFSKIKNIIRDEFVYHCWSVPKDHVFAFREPMAIPEQIFNPGSQRMTTSYDLSAEGFEAITKLGPRADRCPTERAEAEGQRTLRLHQSRERNPKLVADFKASLASFECTICGFDFAEVYGDLGAGYIECHHTKPVAKMKPGDKTRMKDLCAVCSNCHRMLHRISPMLTVEELRKIRR